MVSFSQKVYALIKNVPKGKVTTYKQIAHALNTKAYQAVGQILKRNPYAPVVPCHRVVTSNGTIGGFAGKGEGKEITRKKKLLREEGILSTGNRIKDFEKVFYKF